jgi:hypothetical protein
MFELQGFSLKIAFSRGKEEWWLRHYATNQKVAGSIPDEVIF